MVKEVQKNNVLNIQLTDSGKNLIHINIEKGVDEINYINHDDIIGHNGGIIFSFKSGFNSQKLDININDIRRYFINAQIMFEFDYSMELEELKNAIMVVRKICEDIQNVQDKCKTSIVAVWIFPCSGFISNLKKSHLSVVASI